MAHRLFWRCDKVVCLPDVLYNYRLRSGSIMRTSLKPGAFDAVDGLADRYRFYVENGADRSVIDSAYAACWRRYLSCAPRYARTRSRSWSRPSARSSF